MIVACYAGVGKSYFESIVENSKDLVVMPYKWILPNDDKEKENIKAIPYLICHPHYSLNYLLAIVEANTKYDYVLIPSDVYIMNQLRKLGIPFVLCYPDISLKEHYKERYLKRGNTQNFLDVFIDQWDERIQWLIEYDVPQIVLKENEYLLDVKPMIDKLTFNEGYSKQQLEKIEQLKKELYEMGTYGWIGVLYNDSSIFIRFDINNQKERNLIFKIGQLCYEKDLILPYVLNNEIAMNIMQRQKGLKVIETIHDLQAFIKELEGL